MEIYIILIEALITWECIFLKSKQVVCDLAPVILKEGKKKTLVCFQDGPHFDRK